MTNKKIGFEGVSWDEVVRASEDDSTISLPTKEADLPANVYGAERRNEECGIFYGRLVNDGRKFEAEIMTECGVGHVILT